MNERTAKVYQCQVMYLSTGEHMLTCFDVTKRKQLENELSDKNILLESLSKKLSRHLSPRIYESIFSGTQKAAISTKRKKLTVFFRDIKDFTSATDQPVISLCEM